jgi:hypothetical protein
MEEVDLLTKKQAPTGEAIWRRKTTIYLSTMERTSLINSIKIARNRMIRNRPRNIAVNFLSRASKTPVFVSERPLIIVAEVRSAIESAVVFNNPKNGLIARISTAETSSLSTDSKTPFFWSITGPKEMQIRLNTKMENNRAVAI